MAKALAVAPSHSEDVILFSMSKEAFQDLPSDVQAELTDLAIEEDHRSAGLVQIIVPKFLAKEAFIVAEQLRQCNASFRLHGVTREVLR